VIDNLVAWGANEKEPGTIHHLETVLLSLKIIHLSRTAIREAAAAVRAAAASASRHEKGEDSGDDDDGRPSSKIQNGASNKTRRRGLRQNDAGEDSDSDFDL